MMRIFNPDKVDSKTPLLGAAGDGDCDRNMILGVFLVSLFCFHKVETFVKFYQWKTVVLILSNFNWCKAERK